MEQLPCLKNNKAFQPKSSKTVPVFDGQTGDHKWLNNQVQL